MINRMFATVVDIIFILSVVALLVVAILALTYGFCMGIEYTIYKLQRRNSRESESVRNSKKRQL